jgi:hypothetical protein
MTDDQLQFEDMLRCEELYVALCEARDAMSLMVGWALKCDPAGYSWGLRMVDRANAVLNHESPSES